MSYNQIPHALHSDDDADHTAITRAHICVCESYISYQVPGVFYHADLTRQTRDTSVLQIYCSDSDTSSNQLL